MLLIKLLPKKNVSDFKRTWLKDENQKLFLIDKLIFKKSLIKNEKNSYFFSWVFQIRLKPVLTHGNKDKL